MAGMCRAGSAHSVWTTQGFLKLMGACAFLVYTAQVASFSEGVLSKMGPSFPALPRSKLLRCRFLGTPQRRRLGWMCILFPSQVPTAQVTRGLVSALSQVGCCILITSWVRTTQFTGVLWKHQLRCVMCLLWGADPKLRPSWQMSTVQDSRKAWLATGSLLTVWWRMLVSGAETSPYLLALAVTHVPLCLLLGEGPIGSWLVLLWYLFNLLFSFRREWAAFLGAWCPPPAFRNCFVEVAQCSDDLLMKLSGRIWSPSPIPLPPWDCPPGSCLCIHSAGLGLLVGTSNPCIFRVIIDIHVPIAIF